MLGTGEHTKSAEPARTLHPASQDLQSFGLQVTQKLLLLVPKPSSRHSAIPRQVEGEAEGGAWERRGAWASVTLEACRDPP